MKKILTIITASLILSTTASAEDLESFYKSNKNSICLKLNNYKSIVQIAQSDTGDNLCVLRRDKNKLMFTEEERKTEYVFLKSIEGQAEAIEGQIGSITVETLQNGISSKKTLKVSQILYAYNRFLCDLSDEERETLGKFFIISIGDNFNEEDLINHFLLAHSDKFIFINKITDDTFLSFFINKNHKFNYDSASFRNFVRAILDHRFENAKDIARKVVEDSKFDTILYQAEKACKSYKTKDIASIHTKISEQLKNADFMK